MKLTPLDDKDTIIFKLEKGYLTYIDLVCDIVNIDSSNDEFLIEDNDGFQYSVILSHGLYENVPSVLSIVSQELAKNGILMSFTQDSLTFDKPIKIIENNLTDFLGIVILSTYDNIEFSYINSYTITKNILPVATTFYVFISTIPEIVNTNPNDAIATLTDLKQGQNRISINFQNDYEDLYLLITSNVNKYPLKYNNSATLSIIA